MVVAPAQRGSRKRRRAGDAAVIRPHAERVSRTLRATVGDRGDLWITTRAWLDSGTGFVRPDVSVLSGAPPVDGLAASMALAVVWDATVPTRTLLRCGAREVWLVGGDTVAVHRGHRPRPVATRRAGEDLMVPGAGTTVMVEDLLLPAALDSVVGPGVR